MSGQMNRYPQSSILKEPVVRHSSFVVRRLSFVVCRLSKLGIAPHKPIGYNDGRFGGGATPTTKPGSTDPGLDARHIGRERRLANEPLQSCACSVCRA